MPKFINGINDLNCTFMRIGLQITWYWIMLTILLAENSGKN